MNLPIFLTGLGCGVASVILLKMAKKEKAAMDQAGKLNLIKIKYLKPGLCLTAGKVVCSETIETPYGKTPAVLYKYAASERRSRNKKTGSGRSDQMLASGSRGCRFVLKDDSGEIGIDPDNVKVAAYAHGKLFQSKSGKRTPVGERIGKLKEIDRKNYPDGKKKPFFRKLDMADQPLDIPEDLVEIEPESAEARQALRKYSEKWIQQGDQVFVLGELSPEPGGRKIICRTGNDSPFIISTQSKDITADAFQKNYLKGLFFGLLFGIGGIILIFSAIGVI